VIASLPADVRKHVIHPEATAHIKGFQDLFMLLNTDEEADQLRRLVVNHFNDSLWLQKHLRE
jgi:hypothetical protein